MFLPIPAAKALLFDGDIGLANVDIQLGINPEVDLSDVFSGKHTLTQAITHFSDGGFDIIAGRSGSGGRANLSVDKINTLSRELNELSKSYDVVLLDLGAGIESQVQAMAQLASRCLIVITDEPTSLTDAYAFIKILRLQNQHINISIIVNMAENQREGLKTFNAIQNACESFLKFTPRLAGTIRRDPKVKDAIRAQTPIFAQKTPNLWPLPDVAALAVKLMAK